MATAFCDRPDTFRFHVRGLVEQHDGIVDGYYGDAIQVTLPAACGKRLALLAELRSLGGDIVPCSRCWWGACNGESDYVLRWKHDSEQGDRSLAYVEKCQIVFAV